MTSRHSFLTAFGFAAIAGAVTAIEPYRAGPAQRIVRVKGDLDISVRDRFRNSLRTSKDDRRSLVVSLEHCSFIDCSAVGVLVSHRKELGARLQIVVPAKGHVRRVFDLLGLSEPLALTATLDEALSAKPVFA